MLLENISQYLLEFTGRMENKGVVSAETGAKIRKYVRAEESPVRWELFMIICGLLGAITVAAGVFSLISHNWYDFPKTFRGILSFVPVLVALYFYYRMLFFHKNSRVWVEASSMFLMLMIGASMALVSQTYQMDGDFQKFIKIWLALTIPLFYLARASGITIFYLTLALVLLVEVSFGFFGFPSFQASEDKYWYWLYVIAFAPHFYLSLNRASKVQGVRMMFLTLIVYVSMWTALVVTIEGNYVLWFFTYNIGFYMFAKRFMDGHYWFFSRFMSWWPQVVISLGLLSLSNKFVMKGAFRMESWFDMDYWSNEEWYYFALLLVVLGGLYYNYFRFREHYENINQLILFAPLLILFLMFLDEYTDSWWWLTIPINLYILLIGIITMVNGSEDGRFMKIVAGLGLIALLIIIRYLDVSLGFISKGLLFMLLGGMFFLINMFMKEKVDQIQRNNKRVDEG